VLLPLNESSNCGPLSILHQKLWVRERSGYTNAWGTNPALQGNPGWIAGKAPDLQLFRVVRSNSNEASWMAQPLPLLRRGRHIHHLVGPGPHLRGRLHPSTRDLACLMNSANATSCFDLI